MQDGYNGGDDERRFHPRGLGANKISSEDESSWMTNYFRFNLELGLTTLDMNLCIMLWAVSFLAAVALYCRLSNKWRRKKYRHVM